MRVVVLAALLALTAACDQIPTSPSETTPGGILVFNAGLPYAPDQIDAAWLDAQACAGEAPLGPPVVRLIRDINEAKPEQCGSWHRGQVWVEADQLDWCLRHEFTHEVVAQTTRSTPAGGREDYAGRDPRGCYGVSWRR